MMQRRQESGQPDRSDPGFPGAGTYNLAGTLDGLTLLDETVGTEQDNTDLTGLQVHAHTLDTGSEPKE